ncbi:MAG: SDR family NAD(P)-dependent oxidoreductase [Haliscomenobacter sp.]|nr:SDR family NAD(P)-dependent oxidoreductase [Haliscomenobacter sp.]
MRKALLFFQQALKMYPEAATLRYHYALLLAQNATDLNPAINQLRILLDYHPNDEQANFLMGELNELQQFDDLALRYYQKVADINPDFADIYYRLGIASLKSDPEFPEKAGKYFKKASKRNPGHTDAHYQYALLLAEPLENQEKAIKYFEKTLALSPEHPFANYDLALLFFKEKEFGKAQKYYLRAVSINPELKTPENDLAFGISTPDVSPLPNTGMPEIQTGTPENSPTPVAGSSAPQSAFSGDQLEKDTIEALKENIARLEHFLESKIKTPQPETPKEPVKTVLITGATSGIGKATAQVFAEHGHRLILTGRREDRLLEWSNLLSTEYHAEVFPLVFDVRNPAEVRQAMDSLPEEWQTIDVLINNAGKAKGLSPIHEGKLEHWEEMIDTNIKGLLYMTRVVAPGMVARETGHIINVGSIAGKEIYPNGNVYCASKAAVDALTAGMRLDLHKYNIRVSQVSPGHVEETEFALVRFDGDADRAKIYQDFQPLRARDVAEVIFFQASRPAHVNIQDVVLYGTQQASATVINRSGRNPE